MKSWGTRRFWDCFYKLPHTVQRLAVKNYHLWKSDPTHPSLRFRRLEGSQDLFTIRIGDHHRALGLLENDTVTWVWIGSHAEYDRMIAR